MRFIRYFAEFSRTFSSDNGQVTVKDLNLLGREPGSFRQIIHVVTEHYSLSLFITIPSKL